MRLKVFAILVVCVCTGALSAANPQVTLEISGGVQGTIVLELYPDKAPITVANFIDYVQTGFYDGLIFHRVIEDFMIQGGGFYPEADDPRDTGPAVINESFNGLSNLTGTIAMARTTFANTATAQFFINVDDNTFLDHDSIVYNYYTGKPHAQIGYCVFGRVIDGMDTVNEIAGAITTDAVPDIDIIISSAAVTAVAPVCAEKLPGDLDGDCDIDLADFAMMTQNWLKCNSITPTCD